MSVILEGSGESVQVIFVPDKLVVSNCCARVITRPAGVTSCSYNELLKNKLIFFLKNYVFSYLASYLVIAKPIKS